MSKHMTQKWILKPQTEPALAPYIPGLLRNSKGDSRLQSSRPAGQPNQRGFLVERSKSRVADHDPQTQKETSDNSHSYLSLPQNN